MLYSRSGQDEENESDDHSLKEPSRNQSTILVCTLELLYSRSGRITSLDQSLVDRNTGQCTFTHSAIDIENHQTRMGGKTHSIKFFSHGPPLKVSIHHHFIRAKIQIWKMGILQIKMTEDKYNQFLFLNPPQPHICVLMIKTQIPR